jgi:type IV secretion system protein TrbB
MNSREQMRNRLHEQLCHELGEPVLSALEQPATSDMLLLEDGRLWVQAGGKWSMDPNAFYPPEARESIIGLVAHSLHQEATFTHPNIEGEVEVERYRLRFTGVMPPIVAEPTIALRKPAQVVYTLTDYERSGIVTARQRDLLQRAVERRENILIAGAMGTGKSTMLNALLAEISPCERVGILEDVFELSAPHLSNKNHLHTSTEVSLRVLTRIALRLQLDRIIVGETRGAEALDMLKAWRVGCNGSMATIHANSASAALTRLSSLVQEAGVPEQRQLIAEAVQLIVFMEAEVTKDGLQRRVTEIVRVHGLKSDGDFYLTTA